jgi:hypothetical protein
MAQSPVQIATETRIKIPKPGKTGGLGQHGPVVAYKTKKQINGIFKQENGCIKMHKLKTRYVEGTVYSVKGKQRKS